MLSLLRTSPLSKWYVCEHVYIWSVSSICSDVGSPVDETSSAVAGILMKVRTEVTVDDPKEIAQGAAVTIGTELAITFEHQGTERTVCCVVLCSVCCVKSIQSGWGGGGGVLKAPLRVFALANLILELHH